MLPILFTVSLPKAPPIAEMRDAFLSVLVRHGLAPKRAAGDMGYEQRQNFERSLNVYGLPVTRLALLSPEIGRAVWQAFKPWFGFAAAEAEDPAMERRLADLESENARLAKEQEANHKRLSQLEEIVRRLAPASTEDERKRA